MWSLGAFFWSLVRPKFLEPCQAQVSGALSAQLSAALSGPKEPCQAPSFLEPCQAQELCQGESFWSLVKPHVSGAMFLEPCQAPRFLKPSQAQEPCHLKCFWSLVRPQGALSDPKFSHCQPRSFCVSGALSGPILSGWQAQEPCQAPSVPVLKPNFFSGSSTVFVSVALLGKKTQKHVPS